MKVALFNTKPYDQDSFELANQHFGHELTYFEVRLQPETTLLAKDFPVVCPFVNDILDSRTLPVLAAQGTKLLALRSAGFNHVNLTLAKTLGLTVVRVPAYSPYAVAEHAVALMLTLNRKIHRAYNRVREGNFSLNGLLGFDLHGKTVGVIGTGRIGHVFIQIMKGFGCNVLAYDVSPSPEVVALGAIYTTLAEVFAKSDIISLHCPLMTTTHHLIDDQAIQQMKQGVMLINTSRGGIIDTKALIKGLKSKQIGAGLIDAGLMRRWLTKLLGKTIPEYRSMIRE